MDAQGTGEVSFSLVLILVNLHKKAGISKLGIKAVTQISNCVTFPKKKVVFQRKATV